MRKIIDEVYVAVDGETESEWLIRYSVVTKEKVGGYWNTPKIFNENEKWMYEVGAAYYMFIFDEDGKIGTAILKLEDELFDDDEKYDLTISNFRSKILDETLLNNIVKIT